MHPRKFYGTLLLTLALSACLFAEERSGNTLIVYDGVKQYESPLYEVTVTQQGKSERSFVYANANKFTGDQFKNQNNHWTNFAFTGRVTVQVRKLTGAVGACEIRPLEKNITSEIESDKLTFTLDSPAKLYLAMENEKSDPLFIFANAPSPRPKGKSVVYWGPGVHEIGKHYRLETGKTYYLDGGAYLKGSFLSEENASDVTIMGHGILSGEFIPHGAHRDIRFDRVAIEFEGGKKCRNLVVRDITIVDPAQYCIHAYGGELRTENVKCFGWWYETDGWVGGDGSLLKDSFFKVNDDIIKLYFKNMTIRDLTIYKQNNGAVFQFGWSAESGSDCSVKNIWVVEDETFWNQKDMRGNRGFLNTASGNVRNTVSNMSFEHIRYDGNLSYLLGIKTLGHYDTITVTDMKVRGKQSFKSYLSGGVIRGITLKDVYIGGKKVMSDEDIVLMKGGDIDPVKYE